MGFTLLGSCGPHIFDMVSPDGLLMLWPDPIGNQCSAFSNQLLASGPCSPKPKQPIIPASCALGLALIGGRRWSRSIAMLHPAKCISVI